MRDFVPSARVVADSVFDDHRITSIEVTLHHFAVPGFDLRTCRSMAYNMASSAAIPVHDAIEQVDDAPALPLFWIADRVGSFGAPPLPTTKAESARSVWLAARDDALTAADTLNHIGVHRSLVNRLLEPFLPQTLLITATDWPDFYHRRQNLADPLMEAEVVEAATAMYRAHNNSSPEKLALGEWHLPYLEPWETQTLPVMQANQVSVARCARAAHLTEARPLDAQEDLAIFHRLITATPPSLSLLEHVATPSTPGESSTGAFTGWHQFRYLHEQGADR